MMVDEDDGRDHRRRSSSTSDRLSSPEAPISDSREDAEAEEDDEDDEVRACSTSEVTSHSYFQNSPELESVPWICRP